MIDHSVTSIICLKNGKIPYHTKISCILFNALEVYAITNMDRRRGFLKCVLINVVYGISLF